MIIFIWFLCLVLLATLSIILLARFFKLSGMKNDLQALAKGIEHGFKRNNFATTPKYPVDLYQWITHDDDNVCEDCLDRATWLPMDIAEWMKEGLPRTREAHTECGDKCRCELVLVKQKQPLGNKR